MIRHQRRTVEEAGGIGRIALLGVIRGAVGDLRYVWAYDSHRVHGLSCEVVVDNAAVATFEKHLVADT